MSVFARESATLPARDVSEKYVCTADSSDSAAKKRKKKKRRRKKTKLARKRRGRRRKKKRKGVEEENGRREEKEEEEESRKGEKGTDERRVPFADVYTRGSGLRYHASPKAPFTGPL